MSARRGEGEVSYIRWEGEPSHQDSIVRTEWSVKTLKDGGVPIKKLAGDIANWDRNQAAALMEGWVKKYGDEIELVLSNNDDMALGAIDIIKNEKSLKDVKIVGVDATAPALEAIKKGELFGSVSSDKPEYARAIIEFAVAKATGGELPKDIKEKSKASIYPFILHHDSKLVRSACKSFACALSIAILLASRSTSRIELKSFFTFARRFLSL